MNKNKISKTVLITLIIISILFLSSCANNNKGFEIKRQTGYHGLDIEFSKSTPKEVYENTTFYSRIIIHNNGAYTIKSDDPAIVSLTSDKLYLTYNKDNWGKKNKSISLEGKTPVYPTGEYTIMDLPEFHVTTLPGAIQHPQTNIYFSICYPYSTLFSDNVCLDFDPYGLNERKKVCTSEEMRISGGQAAPIAITKIVPVTTSTSGLIKPQFMIDIENKGKGMPAIPNDNGTHSCTNIESMAKNWNKVKISGTISNISLECTPSTIKLIDNKATIKCAAKENFAGSYNFLSPITLKLDYVYLQSDSRDFDIIRTKDFGSFSYTPNEACKDKNSGTYCGDKKTGKEESMICDSYGQCIDACSYCASNPSDNKCKNVGVDWSCSCSSEECDLLGGEKCQKNFCEVRECCNTGEKELGIRYKFKDPENNNYPIKYSNLKNNAKIEPLKDYRFKSVFSNSQAYCKIQLFNSVTEEVITKSTELKPCSSQDSYIEYYFDYTSAGIKYLLSVFAYEDPEGTKEINNANIIFTTNSIGKCVFDGQVLNDKVCVKNSTTGVYSQLSKCEFCARGYEKNYEEISFNCDNISPAYECTCSESSVEIYKEYLGGTFNYVNDRSFCEDSNYCCDNPYKIVSFKLKLLGDSTTLFEKSYTWNATLDKNFDSKEIVSSYDLDNFREFKFELNTNNDNNMNIGYTYKINSGDFNPITLSNPTTEPISDIIKNNKIIFTLSETGDDKNVFKSLFGSSRELKITINDK